MAQFTMSIMSLIIGRRKLRQDFLYLTEMKPIFPLVGLVGALWSASMVSVQSQAYTWTTIAGLCGSTNSGSADGTNANARFYYPKGLAVDGAGSLYVADSGNHTIRKITPIGTDWVVSTLAGAAGAPGDADGTNSNARFWNPCGIALDGAGNLYVADSARYTIRRITPVSTNWVVTTIAGLPGVQGSNDGTNTNARFYQPTYIAVDQAGNLYMADNGNDTVRKIAPVGTNWVVSTLAGHVGTSASKDGMNGNAWFSNPNGIALDRVGNVCVADYYGSTIRWMALDGTNWYVTTIAGGTYATGSADGTNRNARFYRPSAVAMDGAGSLFVTDAVNDNVRKITPVGTNWVVSTLGGSATNSGAADGTGTDARFYTPLGVAVNTAGDLYVADSWNHAIRLGRFNPWLQCALSGRQLILSWPTNATGFMPETSITSSLGASWSPVTNGVAVLGDCFVLTNNLDAPVAFYRLRK